MRRNAVFEVEKGFKPIKLGVAKVLHVVEGFACAQERADGDDQDIDQFMVASSVDTRIGHLRKVRQQTDFCQCCFTLGPIIRMCLHPSYLYTPYILYKANFACQPFFDAFALFSANQR